MRSCLIVAALGFGCSGPGGSAEQPAGSSIAVTRGCQSCHSTDGSKSVGPTWKGLYGSEVRLSDGSAVTADEAYLRESILRPSAKTVDGFEEGLMETAIKPDSIPEEDLRALIAYIKSLR